MLFIFFSLTAFHILSMFSMLVVSVNSVWCPGDFLYLNGQNFLKTGEIFCYYLIEYVTYPFGLHLFSFNGHTYQAWSFDVLAEFLHIPFMAV
jgi:hypothetical protein